MRRLFVFDLTYTLLKDDKSISDYSLSVIKECKKRGNIIVIATGKSLYSINDYIKLVQPDAVISNGGSMATADSSMIYKKLIPRDISNDIIAQCLDIPQIEYIEYMGEHNSISNNIELFNKIQHISEYSYRKQLLPMTESAYKISIHSRAPQVVKKVIDLFEECAFITYRKRNKCDITNKQATKGFALKAVAEYFNVLLADVISFGDDRSDLGLLKTSGIGVAVDNGISDIKSIADYICESNNNDGVARFINKYFLNDEDDL